MTHCPWKTYSQLRVTPLAPLPETIKQVRGTTGQGDTLHFTLLWYQVHSVSASQLLKAKEQSWGCFAQAALQIWPDDTKGGCGL